MVGFAYVSVVDGHAHLEHVDVRSHENRQAVVSALIEAACARAAAGGQGAITTMATESAAEDGLVGFVVLPKEQPRTPGQLELVIKEAAQGGDRVLRRRVLRRHRTAEELYGLLPTLDAAPKDEGELGLLVRRPGRGEREVLTEGELDQTVGLVGDSWVERGSGRTRDGCADPDMQLNVMNHRLVAFLAGEPEREPLAGDQLYLDLDLSVANLPTGTRLRIGEPPTRGAVIEVTDKPHTGCGKFIDRFGVEAMKFVNGGEGRPRRLRGLCARVVEPGTVRRGDAVVVSRPSG